MNIEEKRDKLQEFCDERKGCYMCPLNHFSFFECDFGSFDINVINEAYKIAFYYKVKSDEIGNPVKHGKWLICSDGYYPYCSECGNEPKSGIMTKYCPNVAQEWIRSE